MTFTENFWSRVHCFFEPFKRTGLAFRRSLIPLYTCGCPRNVGFEDAERGRFGARARPACPHTGQAFALDPATHGPGHPHGPGELRPGAGHSSQHRNCSREIALHAAPESTFPAAPPIRPVARSPVRNGRGGAAAESHREGTRARSVCRYCAHDDGGVVLDGVGPGASPPHTAPAPHRRTPRDGCCITCTLPH